MNLKDNIDFVGHFAIKVFKKDGSIEEYQDKNLIMDRARQNMAQLVGGVVNGGDKVEGQPINKFVLGNEGHVGDNILDYKKVGSNGFDSTRTSLFSEEGDDNSEYYTLTFDPKGGSTKANIKATGVNSNKDGNEDGCTLKRTVSAQTCTYVITIPDACANNSSGDTSVIAYTEAALYAGDDIFSMKTFPARVKEDTVKFEITWSIVF